jgi:hypothetical protein
MLFFSKEDERLVDVALVDGLWYFAHLVLVYMLITPHT